MLKIIHHSHVQILAILIFGFHFNQALAAADPVAECKDHVQNKIPWDPNSAYETAQKWEAANLDKLCKGASEPKEPGKCFHHIMTGHVNWGSTDKWEWKNAIALCAGTSNADQSITCFQDRIKAGEKWDAAIFQCQSTNSNLNNKVPMN